MTAAKNPFIVLSTQLHNGGSKDKRKRELVSTTGKKIKASSSSIISRSRSSSSTAEEQHNSSSHHEQQQQEQTTPPPPLHLQNNPLLQIPCAVQLLTSDTGSRLTPLQAFVDTGAQVTVLSVAAAERAGLLQMMDRRYTGQAAGVGQCRVLGRLPAGCLTLYLHGVPICSSPAITILEHTHDGVDLLLGLDFLRDHGAIMNLRREEMTLLIEEGSNKREVSIPFIRPRVSSLHNNNNKVSGGDHHSSSSSSSNAKMIKSNNNNYNNHHKSSRLLDSRFCLAADVEDNTKAIDMSGI